MAKSLTVCTTSGCPHLTAGGRCSECRAQAERARGSASQRGYDRKHETRFRKAVLACDPVCVVCGLVPSTVADHHPLSRRQLVEQGLNPNDPQYGRGTCASCHGRETQANPLQRGGWNAR